MPIDTSKVLARSCFSTPEEGGIIGGAINFNLGVEIINDSGGIYEQANDVGDPRNATTKYRHNNGVLTTVNVEFSLTPNEWVAVTPTSTNRLIRWTLAGAPSPPTEGLFQLRSVLGFMVAEIDINTYPDLRAQRRLFFGATASEISARTFYDKTFWLNDNAGGTMLNPKYRLVSDPSAMIRQGVHPTKNDTATTSGFTIPPAGITFVDDNVDQTGDDLSNGDRQGLWWEMAAAVENPPVKDSFTSQITFNSI